MPKSEVGQKLHKLDTVREALEKAREFIEASAFNVPTKDYFDAVMKDIDAALYAPDGAAQITEEEVKRIAKKFIVDSSKEIGLRTNTKYFERTVARSAADLWYAVDILTAAGCKVTGPKEG